MKKKFPIGIQDYRKLKEENYYVVDKTNMIRDFLEFGSEVTLITRPRRFGKTMNMSMLAEYFDITKDSRDIFAGTNIMQTSHVDKMNQYPVIFLSFKDCKGDKESLIRTLKRTLLTAYKKFKDVLHEEDMDITELARFQALKKSLFDLESSSLLNLEDSILFLCERVYEVYQRKIMMYLDEYDTPFMEAYANGYYEELHGVLSSLLSMTLKGNSYLEMAVLTGIQRVSKENIFSGLNNVAVASVADEAYHEYFGFTKQESEELLQYYGLDLTKDVAEMYDGYHFGNSRMYNPWSIVNYAKTGVLDMYWANTGSNLMIKQAMKNAPTAFHDLFERLLLEGKIETMVELQNAFYETKTTASLWGLLANAGYITLSKRININQYVIEIPNNEVKEEFKSLTSSYLSVDESLLSEMMQALIHKKMDIFAYDYAAFIKLAMSCHDVVQKENSYHLLMLGMCAYLSDRYYIQSNREAGDGRSDISMLAKGIGYPHIILEFKYANKASIDLISLAEKGLNQIKEKKYATGLHGEILLIGLAHYKKNTKVAYELLCQ